MKMIRITAVAAGLLGVWGVTSPALSSDTVEASPKCACIASAAKKGVAATVRQASGAVIARTGGAGVKAVTSGSTLVLGTRLSAGANGSASGVVGVNCEFSIGPNQEIDISSVRTAAGTQLCLRPIGDVAAAPPPPAPAGGALIGSNVGLGVGAAAAAAGAAIVIGVSQRNGGRVSN